MNTSSEVKTMKYTTNFIICSSCNLSNNFLISVVEQKGNYYYMEKCPRERCAHVEEIRLINGREAKRYEITPSEEPSAQ